MIKKLPFLALLLILFGCNDFDPMEGVQISINYDLFETFVSFRFVDAETGNLIGSDDLSSVTAQFEGKHKDAILTQVGEHPETINSVFGLISIALNPFEPGPPSENQAIEFTVSATASGFTDASFAVSLRDTGYFTYSVIMPRAGYQTDKPSEFKVKLGILEEGQLEQEFTVISPDNLLQLHFPENVQFLNSANENIAGEITLEVGRYQDFDQTNLGEQKILSIMENGEIKKAVIHAEALAEINILNANGDPVRYFSGDNLPEWQFGLNNWDENRADPEVWSFNEETNVWISEGKATVNKNDSTFYGTFPLPHLTFLAAGSESETREISGAINLQFTKPFIADQFSGEALIVSQQSGEIIHRIPLSISESTLNLNFFVPAEDDITVRLRALGSDYEFASDPGSFVISADQLSFDENLVLRPLKCKFSGTLQAQPGADFPYYPIPARLRIRNSDSGSTVKTLNINIEENTSDYSFFLMLPDGIPVECSLETRSLANDFIIPAGSVQVNSSCQEDQILYFELSSTSCWMRGALDFQAGGDSGQEDIPVRIIISRESDMRTIHNRVFTITPGNSTYNLNLSIPQNTPVNILFQTVSDNNPLIFSPGNISLENPCSSSINQEVEYSSSMIRLAGSINFVKGDGISKTSLPIKLAYLDWKTEEVMKESTHELELSNPVIEYSEFVEDAPLFIRVTRNDPDGLFVTDPFILRVPDPKNPPLNWEVNLIKTEKKLVHATLRVVCPAGEIRPTIQGYFRIPGEQWKELFIVAGNLIMYAEMNATYEIGMILDNKMTDSTFTVNSQNIEMTFELDPADCEKMGWGR
ncbi:MAG: hypothetical protein HN352_09790 [Bacteroidetes bacterium]|jgi:hypothetical protein|nr:hypothetical protein [Bacteroidota bacterium]MBT3750796.1 hypothetical protein [Bacteroidota bacterium]MBT4409850.1 hypothetical protein [Bacteroidota bacterium]MBT5425466.1 hypothetical protein [Bacteroidota bacterium]MBT7465040.1 hypothetical protein [Bacteroidota bacterium]